MIREKSEDIMDKFIYNKQFLKLYTENKTEQHEPHQKPRMISDNLSSIKFLFIKGDNLI